MDSPHTKTEALSVPRSPSSGCLGRFVGILFGAIFFGLFAVAGIFIIWVAAIGPMIQVIGAQFWHETPCTIVSSEVDGKKTFRVAIQYSYEYEGVEYTGKNYSFFTKQTSGYKSKEEIVRKYPVGLETICYVDPNHPENAVISRAPEWNMLWGLFGVPFLLVGLIGIPSLRKSSKSTPASSTDLSIEPVARPRLTSDEGVPAIVKVTNSDFDDRSLTEEPGPITLKPDSSRTLSFIGILFFALIWNGVISIFCSTRMHDWMQGKWNWFPELILIPFLLIGILMVFAAFHSFLNLFNPLPTLVLSRQMIPLGGTATLKWSFNKPPTSITLLTVTLKGIESARYRRGTDTITDTAIFHEDILFETSDPTAIQLGEANIQIPDDTMHSFTGANNQIKWKVHFRGAIPRWPDVATEFSIRVVPHE